MEIGSESLGNEIGVVKTGAAVAGVAPMVRVNATVAIVAVALSNFLSDIATPVNVDWTKTLTRIVNNLSKFSLCSVTAGTSRLLPSLLLPRHHP
jgi:hypothetical protein